MEDRRERDFGLLHKVLGEQQFPFLRKNVVPAAKRTGADMLEFAVPEIVGVIGGRKSFKAAAKSVGKQTPRKQLGEGVAVQKGGREVVNGGESF